jgi:hypothetical protein
VVDRKWAIVVSAIEFTPEPLSRFSAPAGTLRANRPAAGAAAATKPSYARRQQAPAVLGAAFGEHFWVESGRLVSNSWNKMPRE